MARADPSNPIRQVSEASRRCPICGKPAVTPYQPFCSRRCADIDLGRWLKGNYRVETEEQPEEPGGEGDRQAGSTKGNS